MAAVQLGISPLVKASREAGGRLLWQYQFGRIGASMAGRNYSSSLRLDYADNNADIISLNPNPFAKNLANLGISGSNE